MEKSFELKFAPTNVFEKAPDSGRKAFAVEAPEYLGSREQAQNADIQVRERAVEQARKDLASVAVQERVDTLGNSGITAEKVQSHLEAVKGQYSIENVMRVLVPDTAMAYVRAAVAMYIPGTREYAAHQLYMAGELLGESYLEPSKLREAEKILVNLESKLN